MVYLYFHPCVNLCYLHLSTCFFYVLSVYPDPDATLPEGVNSIDVAALIKCYIASLPEPLTSFELYDEIKHARTIIHLMRNILKKLPTVKYMTLELVTALLRRVSEKSPLNKVDLSLLVCMRVLFFYSENSTLSVPSELAFSELTCAFQAVLGFVDTAILSVT